MLYIAHFIYIQHASRVAATQQLKQAYFQRPDSRSQGIYPSKVRGEASALEQSTP